MKRILLIAILISSINPLTAQQLPYHSIPDPPVKADASAMLARYMDGLGYRYYWATEGIRDADLQYIPSEGARNLLETLNLIYDLCRVVERALRGESTDVAAESPQLSFEELRKATLESISSCSEMLRNGDIDLSSSDLVFISGKDEFRLSFWYLINGPMADAMYHTGQVVAFRRAAGNPVDPGMNVLMGVTQE